MTGQQRERPPTVSRAPQFDPAAIAAAAGGVGPESILPDAVEAPVRDEAEELGPRRRARAMTKMTLYASPRAADRLDHYTMKLKTKYRRLRPTGGDITDAMLAVVFAHIDEVEAKLKEGLR